MFYVKMKIFFSILKKTQIFFLILCFLLGTIRWELGHRVKMSFGRNLTLDSDFGSCKLCFHCSFFVCVLYLNK